MLTNPQVWSCLPQAFSTAMDVPFDWLIKIIGHDGGEQVYENDYFKRGFHIQELIDVADTIGIMCVPIEFRYALTPDGFETFLIGSAEEQSARFEKYLASTDCGVLEGMTLDKNGKTVGHAAAWVGQKIVDSRGNTYDYKNRWAHNFCVTKLWRIMKCQQ